jgi:membrane associated rhomboid family serine protease
MKIKYNAPVILTYTLIAIGVLSFCSRAVVSTYFTSPAALAFTLPEFYLRLVSYIAGHGNWAHLSGNITLILLVGPLLEEKYGSGKLLEMVLVTAAVTGLFNAFFFSSHLMGGSGIAFMLILLSSFSNIRTGQIPLTFILVAILFIGNEIISILKIDQISQFSHLAGGIAGAGYGFLRGGKR